MARAAKRPDLGQAATPLEATYSREEVAQYFGCDVSQVDRLISKGRRKPYRGGLYPTFKVSHKCRRIPVSAIERHKRYMANPAAAERGEYAA